MREKELRLAVVLTGGVSLAVFMHGVSRELLKLVRASKIFHSAPPARRAAASYAALNDDLERESDSEEVYFDLLAQLAPEVDLRIVLDVIAGASAGGVNGVMLARALAHDLPLDGHRVMWLKHADALELLDEKAAAGRWSKFYLEPVTHLLFRTWLAPLAPDEEVREKLRRFVRARWFKPPFSGARFLRWLLDAGDGMSEGREETGSLLPDGHALDLFVNVTDFFGHNRTIRLYDPPKVIESEHLHLFRFQYLRGAGGVITSDFGRDNVPALAFAARATSSFPGAFPPATIAELDQVLARRGRDWPGRSRFLKEKFRALVRGGRDPEDAAFIDGSTVNNKPFAAAIGALAGRPAHREVQRRLVFVDPDPETGVGDAAGTPGMMRTMLAALVEIPGNEPIRYELERLADMNREIRIARQVIELARPQVSAQVEEIIGPPGRDGAGPADISRWRATANERAAEEAGFAFQSYFRLKLLSVLGNLDTLIAVLADRYGLIVEDETAELALRVWARQNLPAIVAGGEAAERAGEIAFLRAFDVNFRVRRLRFVIRRLNELYAGACEDDGARTEDLDHVKADLYRLLEQSRARWTAEIYTRETAAASARIATGAGGANDVSRLMDSLDGQMNLTALDDEVDMALAGARLAPRIRHELILSYVGFSFFDVLSFPMLRHEEMDELEEVRIHRISPEDARDMTSDATPVILKGATLRHFGAFFSRAYREHDYLWGRLIAADRLVDVVLDAVGQKGAARADAARIKARLFAAILAAEEPFLKAEPGLIDMVSERLCALGPGRAAFDAKAAVS